MLKNLIETFIFKSRPKSNKSYHTYFCYTIFLKAKQSKLFVHVSVKLCESGINPNCVCLCCEIGQALLLIKGLCLWFSPQLDSR